MSEMKINFKTTARAPFNCLGCGRVLTDIRAVISKGQKQHFGCDHSLHPSLFFDRPHT
jgi:hypothetical protein